MSERALTQVQPVGLSEWTVMREQADMLVKTGFLPSSIKTPEQAVAIILQGRELGIPTMAALQTINVIQGKPTVSPQLMLALIERSRQMELIDFPEQTDERVTVIMKRRGRPVHQEIFGMDDAKRMGLAGKDNWAKQPRTMLKWRAVAACARVVFPDVVLGLYTPEEMGADVELTDDGQIVMGNVREVTPEAQALSGMQERLKPALEGWAGGTTALEVLNRATPSIDEPPPVQAKDQSGPATDEQRRRYAQLLKQADELEIGLSPFEIDESVTRAKIIELGTKLKQVITAAQQLREKAGVAE